MTYDLGIVGAGPAGMTAALTAHELGLSVVVVDEQQRPGGQIFRQPPASRSPTPKGAAGYPWGQSLVADAEASSGRHGIRWCLGATALGVLEDDAGLELIVRHGARTERMGVRRLLIATGAMDLPVAFPGWTLPVVVTAGGMQAMLKAQQVLMARTVVLTGGHPLLLLVAGLILDVGGDIAEIALPRSRTSLRELPRAVGALPGHLGVLANAAATAAKLARSRVPVRRGAIVTAARGDGRVEEVDVAALRADNTIDPEQAPRTVPADGVVLGYGFQPATDLARQAGCGLRWDSPAGGWVIAHDDDLRTTVPNIFVAGEPAGVAGADQARAEGRLAALMVAASLRGDDGVAENDVESARRDVRRARRFASVVQRLFEPPRETLTDLARGDTTVCRCEAVTRDDVEVAIEANPFLSSTNALKLECRTGMGPCQGRYCELTTAGLLARGRDMSMEQVGPLNAQFPIRPATVGEIGRMVEPE